MPARRPIGILDSGVGGLTVLREIRRLLPYEDIVYIGDSARCPYGPRPAEEIRARVFALTDRLLAMDAKLVTLACNSATIAAVEALRAHCPTPVTGMEPAVKPAAAHTRTGIIAVLATEASVAGEKFHRLVDTHAKGVRVITRPCPEFVSLVEAGETDTPAVRRAVAEILSPLLDAGADTLVLGCTHFPFLRGAIESFAGPHIAVLDTGEAVARRVQSLLAHDGATREGDRPGSVRLLTTGDLTHWQNLVAHLCPELPAECAHLAS
jgi:glutamate racemase